MDNKTNIHAEQVTTLPQNIRLQLACQQVLADATRQFVDIDSNEAFDEALNETLRRLGQLFNADRSYLFTFSDDLKWMTNTHEWCAPGVAPQMHRIQNVPIDCMPWWFDHMKSMKPVHIQDVDALPEEAAAERAEFKSQEIKSMISLPMSSNSGQLMGFMGFDAVTAKHCWSPTQIDSLQQVADTIGVAIERRRFHQIILENEQRFNLAIAATGAGLWDWDMAANTVYFSSYWKEMLGYTEDEVENDFLGWKRLWHPEDAAKIEAAVEAHLQGKSKKYEIEHRLRHKDGTWRWILTKGDIIRDAKGNPTRWIGTNIDINDIKQAQQLVIETNLKLERATAQAQEMAQRAEAASRAKSEFLANMSHEIRTPMNGVIGMTHLLLDSELTEDQQQKAEVVLKSAESLLGIINDILDFSKIEAGKMTLEAIPFDLVELLSDFTEVMKLRAQAKNLKVECHLDPTVPRRVVGDPGRLRQILTNLVGNAIKFTEQGTVSIRLKPSANTLGERRQKDGTDFIALEFEVSDTGIGMDPDKVALLFNRFQQLDTSTTRNFGGSGLGLAIARQLCELMHGTISVQTACGKGSVFKFTVLLGRQEADNQTLAVSEDSTKADLKLPLQGRILLVEDNPVNQMVAEGVLAKLGLRADLATNGFNALEIFKTAEPYDLILMDVQMPKMDGYQTTRAIRAIEQETGTPAIPIIAMTAHAMLGDREACLDAGMDDYIAKPIHMGQLGKVLRHWLTRRSTQFSQDAADSVSAVAHKSLPRELAIDVVGIAQNMGLSEEIITAILQQFIIASGNDVQKMNMALANGELDAFASAAHSLKGAASYLQIAGFSELIVELEQTAKNGQTELLQKLFPQFEAAYQVVLQSIRTAMQA